MTDENTRSQPAPPESEALAIASELSHFWPTPWRYNDEHPSWGGPTIVDKNDVTIARLFWPGHPPEETERAEKATAMLANAIVGLAARPKVEDAEVAKCVADLRRIGTGIVSRDEDRIKAADLLERLAGELADLTVDRDEWKQQHENLVGVRQTDIANLAAKIDGLKVELDRRKGDPRTRLHNLCEALQEDLDKSPYTREEWEQVDREIVELQHKLRAAEAKLAEREAELAKADAVIAWFDDYCGPSFKELAGEILIAKFEVAIARHAARQQQKASAEADDYRYVCTNGHDKCTEMYPGPECPYCERRPLPPPSKAGETR